VGRSRRLSHQGQKAKGNVPKNKIQRSQGSNAIDRGNGIDAGERMFSRSREIRLTNFGGIGQMVPVSGGSHQVHLALNPGRVRTRVEIFDVSMRGP